MGKLTTEQKQLLCKCVTDQIEKLINDSFTRQKCEELLGLLKEDLNTQKPYIST